MQDQRRLRMDRHLHTIDGLQPVLIYLAVLADNGIGSLGDRHLPCRFIGIEDNDDIIPCIATGMILQPISHKTICCRQELEMILYKLCLA